MFDNVAFEVVIGLVFVYLLYSLLATIVCEWLSTKLGVRSRLLRIALERMLNDGYYVKIEKKRSYKSIFNTLLYGVQGWARKVLLYEPDAFKKSVAGNFYEFPAIKYLSRIEESHKNVFSLTKPSYLSNEYFATALINFLKDKGAGTDTMQKIDFALKFNTHHIQPKSLQQINTFFQNASTAEDFKKSLMNWFAETMDRTNGWYKRKTQLITFLVGIIIAVSFNVDTISITSILSQNETARQQLVQMGIEASKDDSGISKSLKTSKDSALTNDSIIKRSYQSVDSAAKAAQHVLGLGWDNIKPENVYLICKSWQFNFYKQFNPLRKEFWGIMVTALALSLGAPFWFDLLKKLVSIRNAGINPDEKAKKPKAEIETPENIEKPKNVLPSSSPKNIDEVLDALCDNLKNEHGIVAVALEGNPAYINVMADTKELAAYLSGKYGTTWKIDENNTINISYTIEKTNALHATMAGGAIGNKDAQKTLGFGTSGCFFRKKGSDKTYMVSCWHVMKDNTSLKQAIVLKDIIEEPASLNADAKIIAEVVDGCFSDELGIDVGIAECIETSVTPNAKFSIKAQHRAVDAFDALKNTPVLFYGKTSGLQTAVIFHHKINALLPYPDKQTYLVKDVFSITTKNPQTGINTSPSFGGDSGAVVTTTDGVPLGIVIGGNDKFSYVAKFTNMLGDETKPYHQYSFLI